MVPIINLTANRDFTSYRCLSLPAVGCNILEKLTKLGFCAELSEDGWELVSVDSGDRYSSGCLLPFLASTMTK
jgi:hypothetical protein